MLKTEKITLQELLNDPFSGDRLPSGWEEKIIDAVWKLHQEDHIRPTIKALSEEIKEDPRLVAKVLHVINDSPYYVLGVLGLLPGEAFYRATKRFPLKEQYKKHGVIFVPRPTKGAYYWANLIAELLDEDTLYREIFRESGYQVTLVSAYLEEKNKRNPFAIGLRVAERDTGTRNREIAEMAGVRTPQPMSWEEAWTSDAPVVAKQARIHGGKGKLLLTQPEQKALFFAGYLFQDTIKNFLYWDRGSQSFIRTSGFDRFFNNFFDNVIVWLEEKQWKNNWKLDEIDNYWRFEEYVEPLSSYNWSYRALTDAFGHNHYIALVVDPLPRGQRKELFYPRSETDIHGNIGDVEYARALYIHDSSPFYLDVPSIVSYIEDESEEVSLRGQRISDPLIRDLCLAIGINPDYARAPRIIEEASRRMGFFGRFYGLIHGVDLFQGAGDSQPVCPEVNIDGVAIAPVPLGLPQPVEPLDKHRLLVERMLRRGPHKDVFKFLKENQ